MVRQDTQKHNWVFTLNNPTSLLDWDDFPNLRYGIYSEEVGEKGTYHFQGYLQFGGTKGPRLTALQKMIPGAHLEPQRAKNPEDARKYCCKNDETTVDPIYGIHEFGHFEGQGARSDLLDCKRMIDSGKSLYEVAQVHFSDAIRYTRGLQWYQSLVLKRQAKRTTFDGLTVIVGPTGCGKSHWAETEYPDAYWLTRPQGKGSNAYFDTYEGEKQLVMDEFYGWLPYDFLLRLCDKYKLLLPIKGATAVCQITSVVITSNKHVWDWYKFATPELNRRITQVVHFTAYKECTIYPSYQLYQEVCMLAKSHDFIHIA